MLAFVFILSSILCFQQVIEQLLNKSKTEVQQIMASTFTDYKTNNFGIKPNDNTLRYYHPKKDVTLLFYFNKQNKCKHIKLIEDIENLNSRIQELNSQYQKVSDNKWKSTINNQVFNISIEKEEYNFSVIYQLPND